ncbi:MAG TPA: hypothetical protein VHV83_04160, partial [Armatimonadota bacterium]|nr:hypothetical protein [Armatimonadota bacterium]
MRMWHFSPPYFFSVLLAMLFTLPACAASPWQAMIAPSGSIHLSYAGKDMGVLEPGLFEHEWRSMSIQPAPIGATVQNGVCRSKIVSPNGVSVDAVTKIEQVTNGLHLNYQLTPQKDVRLDSLHVSIPFPVASLIGGKFTADEATKPFPAEVKEAGLYSNNTKKLTLSFAAGATMELAFSTPAPTLLQDDRLWGAQTFSLRVGPQMGDGPVWPAGKTYTLDLTLTSPQGFAVDYDGPVTITANDEWLPLDTKLDIVAGSALDFSTLVPWHTPSGKYGRVIATADGKFAFENQPKMPVRFYGVNLCFSGQYLSHEEADQLATRLQRLGYNAVR